MAANPEVLLTPRAENGDAYLDMPPLLQQPDPYDSDSDDDSDDEDNGGPPPLSARRRAWPDSNIPTDLETDTFDPNEVEREYIS